DEDLARTATDASDLEQTQQRLRTEDYALNTQRVEAQAAANSLDNRIAALATEQPIVASDLAALEARLGEIATAVTERRETLRIVEEKQIAAEQEAGGLQSALEALAADRSTIAERLTELRVRLGELGEQRAAVSQTLRELDAARIQLEADREKAQRDLAEAQERIDQSGRQIEEAAAMLNALRCESGALQQQGMAL